MGQSTSMKILLINTPRSPYNAILKNAPEEARRFIHKKLIGPPLGLLTLAASVKDFDVTVFDTKAEYDLYPDTPPLRQLVWKLLEKYQPDIVGTTVITSEFPYGLEILQTTKKYNPHILTLIGGLHATLCIDDFTDPSIDIVFRGHAAKDFRQLVIAKENNEVLDNIPGAYFNKGAMLVPPKVPSLYSNPAVDDFIMPDRSHVEPWRNAYYVGNAPYPSTYMFTSLGCPYKCTFCSVWKEHEGKYYQRNINSIIEELKCINYKIVRFADANTVVDIKFMHDLFDRIKLEGIQKEYIMDIRADIAVNNPGLIEKFAKGGLKIVICGFESFREDELRKYNKSYGAGLIEKAINIFHDNGIMLRGNYVIPNDYSKDDFKALSDYASSHKVNYAGYTILTPMPGTVLYQEKKDEIIDHNYLKYNFFNSVLKTKLPIDEFYNEVGKLWLIKKGTDVI